MLTDKMVLITGSSDGLGKELALTFAANGYNIILHGRDAEKLIAIEDEIQWMGVEYRTIVGDITYESTIEKLTDVADEFGIDILINNVGAYYKKELVYTELDFIRELLEVNLAAPILLTKNIMEIFKKKKSGRIININSIASKFATEDEPIYSASKCGLRGFSNSLKFEAMKYNVIITDIYLGAMGTKTTSDRKDRDKLMKIEEVADIIFSISKNYSSVRISEIDILRSLY